MWWRNNIHQVHQTMHRLLQVTSGYSPSSPGCSPTLASKTAPPSTTEEKGSPIALTTNFSGCIAIPSGPFVVSDLIDMPSNSKRRKTNAKLTLL